MVFVVVKNKDRDERPFEVVTSGRTYRKFQVVKADTLVLMGNNTGFAGSRSVRPDCLHLT